MQAADREIARQTAIRARAVAEFAASRPADADRGQGEPGAMSAQRWAARPEILRPVSEWAGREMVLGLSISAQAAEALLERSLILVHRLPGTLAALEAGALHPGHLWTMREQVAGIEDPLIRAQVEALLLRWMAGRVVSPAQLGDKARREVARRDARAAARKLERALTKRGVHLRPDAEDGMATLTVVTTMPEAQALYRALGACADSLDDADDLRTRGQKMVDCLLDLVLRSGEHALPTVQVLLTVVASMGTLLGGDQPGEIDGQVVPAEMIRQFLTALTADRQPAAAPDPGAPDSSSSDPGDSGASDSGAVDPGAADPGDPDPGDEEFGWDQRTQAALERWWADVERRLLSGELADPDPEPIPDNAILLPHWTNPWDDEDIELPTDNYADDWADDCADNAAPPQHPEGQYVGAQHTAAAPHAQASAQASAQAPCDEQPSADAKAPAHGAPSEESGWWSSADQAVEEAGLAPFQAQQSLARAQRLVRTATTAEAADEAAWQAAPAGRVTAARDAVDALWAASDTDRELLAALLGATGGGGLVDRPRIALTDALSGALLALTDLPQLHRTGSCGRPACTRNATKHTTVCGHDLSDRPGLGPPGPTDGYRPSAALDRWMRARDRRCRFPGCRRPVPRAGELDHHRPYPLGPTSSENLAGYCTTDHRGKHQAPGWKHQLDTDGTLTVTTPTGLVASTTPPPY